jgi:hypothetical protein
LPENLNFLFSCSFVSFYETLIYILRQYEKNFVNYCI